MPETAKAEDDAKTNTDEQYTNNLLPSLLHESLHGGVAELVDRVAEGWQSVRTLSASGSWASERLGICYHMWGICSYMGVYVDRLAERADSGRLRQSNDLLSCLLSFYAVISGYVS
jgi:hypothetical protein